MTMEPDINLLMAHPWFATALAALVAVPVSLLLHRFGGQLLLRLTRQRPRMQAMVRNGRSAARWALPLLALQLVLEAAPDSLPGMDAVRLLTGRLLIVAMTWLLMRAIAGFATSFVARPSSDLDENLQARRRQTQGQLLARAAMTVILVAGASALLMTFPGARKVGTSLLASAGVIGIIAGLAAKPVFSNMIAGLQIALAQPIRIDDVVVVEGEWGRVEEITSTFVVVRLWDDRCLILPLTYFIEKPFQNWTRSSAQMYGTVFMYVDYAMPIEPLRAELHRIVRASAHWDRRSATLWVTDATDRALQLRIMATAANSLIAFELRCAIREGLIDFMRREYPQFLPRMRIGAEAAAPATAAAAVIEPLEL